MIISIASSKCCAGKKMVATGLVRKLIASVKASKLSCYCLESNMKVVQRLYNDKLRF